MLSADWLSGDAGSVVTILGILIPLFTGVVTKKIAAQGTKAVVTLIASILLGSIAYLVTADGGYDWRGFVNSFLNAFVPAIASYYGLWKPTGLAGTVANATANVGIGRPPVLETDDKGQETSEGLRH